MMNKIGIKDMFLNITERLGQNRFFSRASDFCELYWKKAEIFLNRLRRRIDPAQNMGNFFWVNCLLIIFAAVLLLVLLAHMVIPYSVALREDKNREFVFYDQALSALKQKAESVPFDRDIFYSRRLFPFDGDRGRVQDKKISSSEFEVMGIISLQGQKTAVIKDISDGRQYSLLEGDTIKGYYVKEIMDNKVILEKNGTTTEVFK